MSLLIKGMTIPDFGCADCPMCIEANRVEYSIEWKCVLLDKLVATSTCEPDKDCPLVELPPHGRLIDADALMQHEVLLPMDGGHLPIVYASYVRNAPTIIESEDKE